MLEADTLISQKARSRGALAAVCVAAFLMALALGLTNNDFPYQFHPDEGSKAAQVISGDWNYRHPLLLVRTARVAAWLTGAGDDMQAVTRAGRTVSAVFAAGAVGVLVLAVGLAGGLAAGGFAAVLLSLCAPLIAHAHYMKEEAALAFGIGLTVLGAWLFLSKPVEQALRFAFLLGAAAGLAASAKYAGVCAVVVSVGLAAWRPGRRAANGAAVLAGALVVWALVNATAFRDFAVFSANARAEVEHAFTDHLGVSLAVPNAHFLRVVVQQTPWFVLLLSVVAMGLAPRLHTPASRQWFWFVAAFGAVFAGALCFTVIPFSRYALPVVVLLHVMAAVGLGGLVQILPRRFGVALAMASCAAIFVSRGLVCRDYVRQFGDDSRLKVREWLAENLPPDAVIGADASACIDQDLSGGARKVPQRIQSSMFAADLGDAQSLASSGVTHVVICDLAYSRFFQRGVGGAGGQSDDFERRRDWYRKLIENEEPVWSSAPTRRVPGPTNPRISVHAIEAGNN